ncbi:MAG: family 10 glycosylhydrolase [Parabacteroides sp.]|nr:family 10 glycosylhydrolase [Parabacteroides sp.]
MKKRLTFIIISFLCLSINVIAQSPKREMRATWIATVGGIDFPKNSTAVAQKTEMLKMLDSIASLKMNAVFFQVRSRCDAMYNSAYEPWSSDLKGSRGQNPGWDPLEFVVNECHKRGLECHAWLNPYRYNNSGSGWTGSNNSPLNYENTHPDWLLHYSSYIILDPALQEVQQQIKNIVGDIISKYNVDGIIFDDYFYPYGGTTDEDAASVAALKPADMNVYDWRRDNINRMVAAVYDTIQAVSPWVTFGISPFGIWTTNSSVAAAEGIELPAGITGGNMYQEIYCDPVAWLKAGTVDYISPQLYWKIGGSQDYNKLCPWWANLANRFGRQFYSSMALYRYNENNSSNTGYYKNVAEFKNQTLINRSSSNDNAPGAVFYNTLAWVNDESFRNEFRANVFQHLALAPSIHWKPAPEQEPVSFTGPPQGSVISWTHANDENVMYAVYAVPTAKRNESNAFSKSDYLVAITYDKKFTMITGASTSTHKIAVSVIDRYGNEYAPRVFGESAVTPTATTLTYPADNAAVVKSTLFQWKAVPNADCYVWQLSRNQQFTDLVCSMETTDIKYNSGLQTSIADNTAYWWRVKTRKANANDIWSDVRKVTVGTVSNVENIVFETLTAFVCKEGGIRYVHIQTSEAVRANISVYSIVGQCVSSSFINLSAGDNRIPLSFNNVLDGIMYLMKIQTNNNQITLKITN